MSISTESELLACFRDIDRADVELPKGVAFPLAIEPILSWNEGPRSFVVFRERPGARPKGIVFHRASGAVPEVAAMCEWCHAVRSHGGVKLLTAAVDVRRRVGLYLCADIGCVGRARERPSVHDFDEGLDAADRERRIVGRIGTFASRRLF